MRSFSFYHASRSVLNSSLDNIDVRYTTANGAEWSPRGAGTWYPFSSFPTFLDDACDQTNVLKGSLGQIYCPSDTYFVVMTGTMYPTAYTISGGVIDVEVVHRDGTYDGRNRSMVCHSTSNILIISAGISANLYCPIPKPKKITSLGQSTTHQTTPGRYYFVSYFNYGGSLPTFTGATVLSQFTNNISGSSYFGAAMIKSTQKTVTSNFSCNMIELVY